jgi:hypothetical protein
MVPLQAGDLLFYRPHDLAGRLDAHATGGPYSHCAIALDATSCVEALGRGVALTSPPIPPDAIARTGARLSPRWRPVALQWLQRRVGAGYGWLDIVADGLRVVLPGTPFLVAPSQYDCSHLATCFLLIGEYPLPAELVTDQTRVSPNDLARTLRADGVPCEMAAVTDPGEVARRRA